VKGAVRGAACLSVSLSLSSPPLCKPDGVK
jgi:hypothetical protein